jgi:AraC-like DNA-binding protein
MKPLFYKLSRPSEESIEVLFEEQDHFYDNLHFHPEVQIMAILESTGTHFIGDSIGNFKPGDILLLGSNLPHVFRNEKKYYEENSNLKARNISIFFDEGAFGEKFFSLPEFFHIQKLLQNSKRGIRIKGETNKRIAVLIEEVLSLKGFERLMHIFTILNILSKSTELKPLSSVGFYGIQKDTDSQRINDVFTYIMKNLSEDIKLQEAAGIANMSVNAFCRYFKKHTRKTFSKFLNEIRIGHACRLLIEEKWNIREIAFECGYDNISYFNRQFKEITKYNPKTYIKMQQGEF